MTRPIQENGNSSPQYVDVFNNRIFLGSSYGYVTKELIEKGIWEQNITKFINHIVKPNDVVLDIGANIGYFSLLLAEKVGKGGKVFAFEPEPKNFELLKKNIMYNGYNNVSLENIAVSSYNGEIELFLSNVCSGMHRIYPSKHCSTESVKVKVQKLDSYFKNEIPKISFIKIDVEGSEFGVLKGMEKIITQNQDLKIILEFFPNSIKEYGVEPTKLLKLLDSFGFIYIKIWDSLWCFKTQNYSTIITIIFFGLLQRAPNDKEMAELQHKMNYENFKFNDLVFFIKNSRKNKTKLPIDLFLNE